jgi:L-seryl-tRNA(Ser) seleniumtransferase
MRSMTKDPSAHPLRRIPSMDRLLAHPEALSLAAQSSRPFISGLLKRVLADLRRDFMAPSHQGLSEEAVMELVLQQLKIAVSKVFESSLRRVINATGVVLHTNLGRAPLNSAALDRVAEVARHYSNLEYVLEEGVRGRRDQHVSGLLNHLLDCEQSIVVNNNAAAVFLILNTLAGSGEVLISRGELIEIGDSFRIPEILEKSGAVLREVGTTNRTHLEDYRRAFNERTRLVLRVHPSNFRVVGFASRPNLDELLKLCRKLSIPLVEDLGSGCLVDLGPFGIADEPMARRSLELGVPIVCFSGDKLLGGPQAGVIAGQAEWIGKIRSNPLYRALRVDKLTLAALEGTLLSYLVRPETPEIPVIRMIQLTSASIRQRSEAILAQLPISQPELETRLVDGYSKIGGGSTPEHGLQTCLISLRSSSKSASEIECELRSSNPPILTRIEKDCVLIDLRTVFLEEESDLVKALINLQAP